MAEVLVEEFEHDVGGKWVLILSLRDHKLQSCFQLCCLVFGFGMDFVRVEVEGKRRVSRIVA